MMQKIYYLILVAIACLVFAGCSGEKTENTNSIGGKITQESCYSKDRDACWATFPDGMKCMQWDGSHGETGYSSCVGGFASDRDGKLVCYSDELDLCWVRFSDGMTCLSWDGSHGETGYSSCEGGQHEKYRAAATDTGGDDSSEDTKLGDGTNGGAAAGNDTGGAALEDTPKTVDPNEALIEGPTGGVAQGKVEADTGDPLPDEAAPDYTPESALQ